MHKEYVRIVENADVAILFIHGIVGTPNHFNRFIKLIDDSVSIYNVLLDGHGKGVKDFSKTSMTKWRKQIAETVEKLANEHEKIYIVAHSLGCLLSIEQAVSCPKVEKMFLLAVPLKVFLKPKAVLTALRVYRDKISSDDAPMLAAKECCGVEHDKNILSYLGWIPRFVELLCYIKEIRKSVKEISITCFAYQSRNDELVLKSAGKLLEENALICVKELKNSGHYYYEKEDFTLLEKEFLNFIK